MSIKVTIQILLILHFVSITGVNISESSSISTGEATNHSAMLESYSRELIASSVNDLTSAFRKDTNVLLTVDTENITQENYEETVFISDDRSENSQGNQKPSEHIALVDKNMKIYWSAEPLDPETGTTVDVLGIYRKTNGGAEILDGVFRDPNKDGIVMGKIKNKKVQGMENYNILIRVNGETPETFIIDPKIRMDNL